MFIVRRYFDLFLVRFCKCMHDVKSVKSDYFLIYLSHMMRVWIWWTPSLLVCFTCMS